MLSTLTGAWHSFNPSLRRIVSNTGWLFIDRILRLAIGFAVGVLVARYLGPDHFGVYATALALVTLFSTIATLGIDDLLVREILLNHSERYEILGTAFVLKLLGGCLSILFAVSTIRILRPQDELTHWLVAILSTGVIFQSFDVIEHWFHSQVQARFVVLAKSTAFILSAAARAALVYLHAPLLAFAWAGAAELALGAATLVLVYVLRREHLLCWRFAAQRARGLLLAGWPLLLSSIAIIVYMRIDQVMLRELAGEESAGIYAAATRLSEACYFIPIAIVSSTFPAILEARSRSETLYYHRLQRLFRLLFGLALAIVVPISIFATPIVHLTYGQRYLAAGPVLAIHIWAALFVFLGVGQSRWFIAENLPRLVLYRTALGALVNVVLNFLLIPTYAAVGAALATVVSYAMAAFLANALQPRTHQLFRLQVKALVLVR
jgi:PST family polysaccharide transporter